MEVDRLCGVEMEVDRLLWCRDGSRQTSMV